MNLISKLSNMDTVNIYNGNITVHGKDKHSQELHMYEAHIIYI